MTGGENAVHAPRGGADTTPGMARLTMVELRKLIDTRSGYWLLIVMGLAAAAVAVVQLIWAPPAEQVFGEFFAASFQVFAFLLPVLGILLVTSEWTQRTTLTSFALVPRRHRLSAAKIAAATLAGLAAVVVSLVVGAAANVIAGGDDWRIRGVHIGYAAISLVVIVLTGVAFGMLLLNSAVAIVAYFILPTAWTILASTITGLRGAAQWLDTSVTTGALFTPHVTAGVWARLGVSVAVWVLLPLAIGLVRVNRREVS